MVIISELYLIIVGLSVAITGLCTVLAWSRRYSVTARTLAVLMGLTTFLSLMYLFESLSPTSNWALFFFKLRHPALSAIPIVLLLFTLQYTNRQSWCRPEWFTALLCVPVVSTFFFWFNHESGWLYSSLGVDSWGVITVVSPHYGPMFPIWSLFVYGLVVVSVGFLVRNATMAKQLQYQHLVLITAGVVAATLMTVPSTLLQFITPAPTPFPNLNSIGFAIGGGILTMAVFRYNLLTMLPIANDHIVDSMLDAVIAVDLEMRIVQFNRAAEKLTNRKLSTVLGKTVQQVFPRHGSLINKYADYLESDQDIPVGRNGEIYALKVFPIYHTNRQLVGKVVILRDITERKLAEQHSNELALERERVDALSNFIRDTSHELRTPLSVMGTCLYLLRKGISDEARDKQMNMLDEQMNKMSTLVNQLEQMVALDTELTLVAKPLSLNIVSQSVPPPFEALCAKKGLQLSWYLMEDIPSVRADKMLLRNAFLNLLHNAIIYTPNGGRIDVRTGVTDDSHVYLEVVDTGIGISADALSFIFERFYKADKARTTNASGLGLGLSMVKKIIDLHRGTVEVVSEEGKGSTFRLVFPPNRVTFPTSISEE